MNNRIISSSPVERHAFGLVAWLEQTRIVLPLKGVECSFSVCGDVVSVEIDQIFHQNNAQPLDCLYSFPLPAGAAIYRCEMHVNGRVIRARVEEREAARNLAARMKAAGYRTALVEMERDNLFTLALGNVQPGDLVVIRFAYFQTLTRLGDWISFRIPFCPGVRYIPGAPLLRPPSGRGVVDDTDQVPDASRISPPRMDKLHPDAAYLSVQGKVEHPLGELKDISSPTHPVFVRVSDGGSTVSLADEAAVPDSDFVVRWTETIPEQARLNGWITGQGGDTFALARLCAPREVESGVHHLQDFYFLIDRSGSMEGLKWKKAVEAFREFLKVLGDDDRVWATFFETTFQDLAEKPMAAKTIRAGNWGDRLESLGTGGGTELLPALEHVLHKIEVHSTGGWPVTILLITDGQVGNEAEILQRLARHADLRVDVFGIDVTINDGFLNKLAAQHQGTSCLMAPTDDIAGAVSRLGARLRQPVLTSIQVKGGWELAGRQTADLHAGEVLLLPLRRQKPDEKSVSIEAKDTHGASRRFTLELVTTDMPALRLLWAKQRINFLLAQSKAAEAIVLAKNYNLVCEGAAFIAWDEAEKVQVSGPDREVYQPVMNHQSVVHCCLMSVNQCDDSPFARHEAKPTIEYLICKLTPEKPALPTSKAAPTIKVQLQRLCATVGHPEWNEKCQRVAKWASSNDQAVVQVRRQKLELLIHMLRNDARSIVALAGSLLQTLERIAASPVVPGPLRALLNGSNAFEASYRQGLLAALEHSTIPDADKARILLQELEDAETQMLARIDEFLQRYVEESGQPKSGDTK
jgi:Ca-activated chloride channel homolog